METNSVKYHSVKRGLEEVNAHVQKEPHLEELWILCQGIGYFSEGYRFMEGSFKVKINLQVCTLEVF